MFERPLIQNYPVFSSKKKALVHYKILPSANRKFEYHHTNLWEIKTLVGVLNYFGYNVDLVDRRESNWVPNDDYKLFISNASGNSGHRFGIYASHLPSASKILWAAGPRPDISASLVHERYDFWEKRNGKRVTSRLRIPNKVSNLENFELFDFVIAIDDNGFSCKTYSELSKPIFLLRPSASPKANFERNLSVRANQNSFALFLGHGFIVKGADLVIESWRELENAELMICGPMKQDHDFYSFYKSEIRRSKRIQYLGNIPVGGRVYKSLASKCTWLIHNSASEGSATSITTLIQAGLIPITNYESGVDVANCGIEINNHPNPKLGTLDSIRRALDLDYQTVSNLRRNVNLRAQNFSQSSFKKRLFLILEEILGTIET